MIVWVGKGKNTLFFPTLKILSPLKASKQDNYPKLFKTQKKKQENFVE